MEESDGDLSARGKTILVIEDDPVIRETIQLALELEGYRVVTASHGGEGLRCLSQIRRPCLILLDLMMPVMDGFEFLRQFKKESRLASIPVVVITAFDELAKNIGVSAVIKKPLNLDVLSKTAHQWCCESV